MDLVDSSSQGCGLGLEMVLRRISVSARLDEDCQRRGLVSVSAIDISCPRPIFRQILQATIIKQVSRRC